MTNKEILREMEEKKIIAIARGISPENAVKLAEALYAGGIRFMEFPFNMKDPIDEGPDKAIAAVSREMEGKMIAGCGTCSYIDMVNRVHNSGGKFVISADMNPEVIKRTKELGMISIPGIATASEAMEALRYGADCIKVFPAANLGSNYIKALRAPLSHVKFMAVGGVSRENIKEFVDCGCIGVGVGGSLVKNEYIEAGKFDEITKIAKDFVSAIK